MNCNVFHPGVTVWIVCAADGTLIITEQSSGHGLQITKLKEKIPEPEYIMCTMACGNGL